ncbi:S-type pyocin domain-containing protein, partial [Escherichia coli]
MRLFYQFPAFTDTLWLEVSQYPELIAQFSTGNQTRIKQGLIAKAPLEG